MLIRVIVTFNNDGKVDNQNLQVLQEYLNK